MPGPLLALPALQALHNTFGPADGRPRRREDLQPSPFMVRHAHTFQGILTTAAKTYRWAFDEALRQSPHDARMMRLDGWLTAMLRERQRPVARAKWHIAPEDERDPRQKQAADLITKLVERIPRFSRLRMMLRECDWFGKYAVQTVTKRVLVQGAPRKLITNWLPVHGDKLLFRHDGTPCLMIWPQDRGKYEDQGYTVEPSDRGYVLFLNSRSLRERFIIDTFEITDAAWEDPDQAGQIAGVGLRHHVQWLWWLRAEVVSQVLDYMGRIGAGGLTIVWYEDGNDASFEKAQQTAKDLEAGNVILAPRGRGTDKQPAGVERIEANTAGSELLLRIVDEMFESKIERLFIGQSASSSSKTSGMGTHDTDFQQDTKHQLLAADAADLDDSLTTDLIEPLVRWNLPGVDYRLKFVTDLREPNNEKMLEGVVKAYGLGAEFSEESVRQLVGLPAPQPGDKVLSQRQASLGGLANPGLGGPGGAVGVPGAPMGGGNGQSGDMGPGGGGGGPAGVAGSPGLGGAATGEAAADAAGQLAERGNEAGSDAAVGEGEAAGAAAKAEVGQEAEEAGISQEAIQEYFKRSVEEGLLFDPKGLQRLKRELESGGWRWTVGRGLERLQQAQLPSASPQPQQYARLDITYDADAPDQYARVQWSPYTDPKTGRHGWKSAGGRVLYDFDPSKAEAEPTAPRGGPAATGTKTGGEFAPTPGDPYREKLLHHHEGVQRGTKGSLKNMQDRIGYFLKQPTAITEQGMHELVTDLMGLTVTDLRQLGQQFQVKRQRKAGTVAAIGSALQSQGLPAPKPAGRNREADLEDAAKAEQANRRMALLHAPPEASRDPTLMESATGIEREPGVGKPWAPGRFGHPSPVPPETRPAPKAAPVAPKPATSRSSLVQSVLAKVQARKQDAVAKPNVAPKPERPPELSAAPPDLTPEPNAPAKSVLPPRVQAILDERRAAIERGEKPKSFRALGKELGISHERVRQLEQKGLAQQGEQKSLAVQQAEATAHDFLDRLAAGEENHGHFDPNSGQWVVDRVKQSDLAGPAELSSQFDPETGQRLAKIKLSEREQQQRQLDRQHHRLVKDFLKRKADEQQREVQGAGQPGGANPTEPAPASTTGTGEVAPSTVAERTPQSGKPTQNPLDFIASQGLTATPVGPETTPKPAGPKWSQSTQGLGHAYEAAAAQTHTPGSALAGGKPLAGMTPEQRTVVQEHVARAIAKARTKKPTQASPPSSQASPAMKATALPPEKAGQGVVNAIEEARPFVSSGLVDMPRIAKNIKKTPGLENISTEQLHSVLDRMWRDGGIEMHIRNEVRDLTPEQVQLGMRRGSEEELKSGGGKLYYYAFIKDYKKAAASAAAWAAENLSR